MKIKIHIFFNLLTLIWITQIVNCLVTKTTNSLAKPDDTEPERPVSLLLPTECGSNIISNRIYGGKETELGEFPWMAMIEYTKGEGKIGHHCGGSLINNRYVVTSAICVKKIRKDWHVSAIRLGEYDTDTNPDCVTDLNGNKNCALPYIDIPVEKVIVHEGYNPNLKEQINDIALIRLAKEVQFTDYIKPICLPITNYLQNLNLTGIGFEISGWGRTDLGSISERKLKAFVNGVSLHKCNEIFAKTSIVLQETQLCAGGIKGIDSCNGDSGGPLIGVDITSPRHNFYLAGIVSFGSSPCGLEGWPGVYTKIAPYVDWIQENLEP